MVNLNRNVLIAVAAITAVVLAVTGLTVAGVIPLSSTLSCLGVPSISRTFTIIADLNGFNNSKNASPSGLGIWPAMNVSRCDNVTIKLVNADTQAHGLAVGVFYMKALNIPVGQTLSVSFTAYKMGQFRVYCTLTSCSVHDYMQNGQLNVT